MKKYDQLRLRDTLIACTPTYPEAITFSNLALRLRARKGIELAPYTLAYQLKRIVSQGYLCRLGARRYTRPRTPADRVSAANYERPRPAHERHHYTPGLAEQVKAINDQLVAEMAAYRHDFSKPDQPEGDELDELIFGDLNRAYYNDLFAD